MMSSLKSSETEDWLDYRVVRPLSYLGNSLQSALRAIEENRSSVNDERKSLADVIASRVKHVAPQEEEPAEPVAAEENPVDE